MPRGQAPGKKNNVKYPNTNTLAGASLAARKARDKARKEKAAAKARAEEFGSDMSPTMTAYEKSKARAVSTGRSASIKAGDGKPDPKKLANPKTKTKTESDSRYRPGKGGVGDARYRPGAGSVASQLAQSGIKVTKKPSTPTTTNASTSTTKKPKTPTKTPTYRGGQRKAAPKKGSYDTEKKQIKKGPGVGKQDKADPRKDFKSKPVKNATLPAGAKPFKGGYDSKTHKLQNIRGKTYVVPKPKPKKK